MFLYLPVSAEDLPDPGSLDKQYVYLIATSTTPGFQFRNEIKILVSYRNAMVLLQIEKPIYNPGQTRRSKHTSVMFSDHSLIQVPAMAFI